LTLFAIVTQLTQIGYKWAVNLMHSKSYVKEGVRKMARNKKKGRKSSLQGRDVRKEISAKQYIEYLLELHRLQGVLLQRLEERIKKRSGRSTTKSC
jgi:hypothetical protein